MTFSFLVKIFIFDNYLLKVFIETYTLYEHYNKQKKPVKDLSFLLFRGQILMFSISIMKSYPQGYLPRSAISLVITRSLTTPAVSSKTPQSSPFTSIKVLSPFPLLIEIDFFASNIWEDPGSIVPS